jgi:acyl-coenzyme A thioesterase PaaI-like protein
LTSETLTRTGRPARSAPAKRDRDGTFEFDPHHCFACGELNEHGLHLAIHTDPDHAWTETTLEQRFQGWETVAHGGIVCTLLDEAMAWAVIGRGTWGVTARLSVAFRRPIPVGRPIRADGRVVDENRRAHRTAGRLLDATTGELLATAEGTFMAVPPAEVERLKARYGMRRLDDAADGAAGGGPNNGEADTTERADGSKAAVGPRGSAV